MCWSGLMVPLGCMWVGLWPPIAHLSPVPYDRVHGILMTSYNLFEYGMYHVQVHRCNLCTTFCVGLAKKYVYVVVES